MSPWLDVLSFGRGGLGLVFVAIALGQPRLLVLAVAFSIVASFLVWWRRTWSFDGGTLTLDDGVLSRTLRRVPVTRVQQVEVSEPLLHRMAGLAVVRIETAGAAGQAEVVLDALGRPEAEALRRRVLEARARALAARAEPDTPAESAPGREPSRGGAPTPPETEILRLSTGRVMLAGITGSNLLVVFAVMGALFDTVSRLPRDLAESVEDQASTAVVSLGLVAGVLMLVLVALVAAALSAVATHHGLTVVRSGDELRLRRGLFERRDAVVPLVRVQAVSVRQNPAQRLLGLASVQIRSAGTGAGGESRLSVPLADRLEIGRLLEASVGRPTPLTELRPAPPAARGRRVARRIAVVAPLAGVLVLVWGIGALVLGVALTLLAGAILLGLDAYRNLGHRVDGELLITRWGSLLRRTVVVVIPRVQSTRLVCSPLQRWRQLATLRIDLAGRGIAPTVLDQAAARGLELEDRIRAHEGPVPDDEPGPAGLGSARSVRETGNTPTHRLPPPEEP